MITGEKRRVLTPQAILEKVSQYSIYRYYLPDFHKLNDPFINTLRGEKNPSMTIIETNTGLRHFDYGNSFYKGNCFDIVKQKFFCDFNSALLQIDRDFNLGLSQTRIEQQPSVITWKEPKIEKFGPPVFHVKTRNFSPTELKWWNLRYQDLSDLKREHIYAPKEIWRNGSRIPLKASELVFCYFYPTIGKWKIYRPEIKTITKDTRIWERKWDSNVPYNYCDGLEDIKECDFGFLTKSRKDKMLLKKALMTKNIADIQAENESCITETALDIFEKNCKTKVVVMDNDTTGKRVSWWLSTNYNFKHCNVPDNYIKSNCTDFTDVALKYGIDTVTNHFRNKGFIK